MSDHGDSEHGYTHITISVERAPGVDTEELFDRLIEVVEDACDAAGDDPTTCAIDHYASMSQTACLFPEDGDPMTRHVATEERF